MNGLVPADSPGGGGLLSPLTNGTGSFGERLRAFSAQPAAKKVLPWFAGTAGLGLMALTWATLSPAPQRMLYSSLGDAERASVVATLDQAGIDYTIDNNTGALTVGEVLARFYGNFYAWVTALQIGLQLLIKAGSVVIRLLGRLVLFAQHLHDGVHLCRPRRLEKSLKVIEVPVCGQAPDAGTQALLVA